VTTDLEPALPRSLQVEVTGACNLRCRMCLVRYRPPLGRVAGSLPFAVFRRLVDDLPALEEITLQGLGEPLLAPDLYRMIAYATARGIRVGFNTNGTLLTRAAAERLIALGVDWLHVSVDGASAATYEGIRDGAKLATVARNVRELAAALRRSGAARPRLEIVCVAMRRNVGELPALVERVAEWGIGRLWVQNLSHSFSDAGGDVDYAAIGEFTAAEALWAGDNDAEAAFATARATAARLGVEIRLPRLAERPGRRAPGTPGCDWPWRSAYVRHDGKVQPCCMLMGEDRAVHGDLATDDFAAIWRNDAYREFRHGLAGDQPPEVCRGCSLYRGVF
jgi:radical SAM protein with 4Fe4S-binding SPASM domain